MYSRNFIKVIGTISGRKAFLHLGATRDLNHINNLRIVSSVEIERKPDIENRLWISVNTNTDEVSLSDDHYIKSTFVRDDTVENISKEISDHIQWWHEKCNKCDEDKCNELLKKNADYQEEIDQKMELAIKLASIEWDY